MKAIANLDQATLTATGFGTGALAWILGHIEMLTKVGQLVGVWSCAIISLITLATTAHRKWRAWRSSKAPIAEPPDVDDDIPLR